MLNKILFTALVLLVVSSSAAAGVTLHMSSDRVFLSDGTILKCTLICKGKERIVVLVGDQERTLSASSVLRIERGQPAGERESFETGPVGGHEQIIRSKKEDIPTIQVKQRAADKPARASGKRLRAEKDKKGVTPFGDRTKRKKKERPKDRPKEQRQKPAGIDAGKIRKLIKESEPEDLIKVIEDLKKKFGVDKNL